MGERLVWLDLCSGLGGASQPALDRGWRVIRVDMDPRFKPDIVADVRSLPLKSFPIDVLWASPPCQEFSKFEMRCFFPNPPPPDLSIAIGIVTAIARLNPRYWAVENVRASRRWLTQLFGPVRFRNTGHAVWTNVPALWPQIAPRKGGMGYWKPGRWGPMGRADRKRNHGLHGSLVEKDAARAAIVPYEIGEAICIAVERRLGVYEEPHGARQPIHKAAAVR